MLPENMRSSWIFANFVAHMENRYEISGTVSDYAERQDPEFDKAIAGAALIEMIWSGLQSYTDKPREPGWHRRVYGSWPSNKSAAMIMSAEMRADSIELWRMGASRESSELIRAAEASRQLSFLTLSYADGSTAGCEEAIKQLVITCPQLDYEFMRVFPRWNELATACAVQVERQTRVFTDPQAPLKDD